MPTSTAVPLTVFEEHIRQIEQGIRFVQTASDVKRCAADAIDKANGNAHALSEIYKFMKMDDCPEQQYCNANFMSLVAGFEEFLRQTLEYAITARAQSAKSFDDLGTHVHELHMMATGSLLVKKAKPPQQLRSLNFFEVCRNLGTCLPGAKTFTLNPEAISIQTSLLDLESFIETLKKFKYQIGWDILGADTEIKKCMGVKRTRDSANQVRQYIDKMVAQRNRVAHTGSSSDITPAVLDEYLIRLRCLARAITNCLEKKIPSKS
jgi:hypothetical protein